MIEAVIEHVPLHRAFPSGMIAREAERKKHTTMTNQPSGAVIEASCSLWLHFAWFARS